MASDLPSTQTAFNRLPIELNKAIAHFLLPAPDASHKEFREADKDFCAFSRVCKATNHAIDGDQLSFWRAAFRARFALPPDQQNKDLRRQYRRRAYYLRKGTSSSRFVRGLEDREERIIGILKDLIIESFQSMPQNNFISAAPCKNQLVMIDFIHNSNVLRMVYPSDPPTPQDGLEAKRTFAAVRIMCSQLVLDMPSTYDQGIVGIEDSQSLVYCRAIEAPLYHGTQVNLEWIYNCMKFFRYYMTSPEASMLYQTICDLPHDQQPHAWTEPLVQGEYKMPTHWKGTYSFLEQSTLRKLRKLRDCRANAEFFDDLNVDEGKIQSLTFNITPDHTPQTAPWPAFAEQALHSLFGARDSTAIQAPGAPPLRNNVYIQGRGKDTHDRFFTTGWLNHLPSQSGIPGWMRISFFKHFEPDIDDAEEDNIWAYEGVVLPGGKFILGRWWYASGDGGQLDDYSGPFILWAVEPQLGDSEDEESEESEE